MKKRIIATHVLLISLVCASSALATAPLGPPGTSLMQGQFGIALEYAHSNSDFKVTFANEKATIKGVRSNVVLAQPSYGLTDNWQIYALLGAADLKEGSMNANFEFAYGFGTKVNFSEDPNTNTSWGLLFELGWRKASDTGRLDLSGVTLPNAAYDIDIKYYEITIALGPTWDISESTRLYGGPFFHVLEGEADVDRSGVDATIDLDEKTMLGAYIGAEHDLCPDTTVYAEFQFSGNMMVLGTGIGWRF